MYTKPEEGTIPFKEILRYRETDGFFVDDEFNVWHLGRCLGNIWKRELWKEADIKLFEGNSRESV